ncbi:MAG: hypothetical protein LLG40_15765 [Deltaproteobacteria bacterium]|nr:hypothetical protein [Deltaproteobacteria bacterium]
MNAIQLYRLLQQHTGEMNKIVVGLYEGTIDEATAKTKAQEIIKKTATNLFEE